MEHSQTENIYVPRNTQIDSKYLDNEVFILLKETLSSAFTYTGQNVLVKLEPEFEAALKLSLYHLTIGKHKQTVGQQLLRVKYDDRNSPKKMKYYYLCLILGSWLKQRVPFLVSLLKRNDVKSVALKFCDLFETTYQVLDIFNLMLFLVKGKYPSLIERVFCLKVIPSTQDSVQKLSYAYFTRELLWNGFADLLATLLPLIPAKQFHNFIRQFLPSFVTHASSNSAEEEKNVSSKVETICTICNDLAILPHKFGCNHVACYYCIHSAIVVTSYRCSLCGTRADYSQIIPLAL